jgi:hypothetical protein
MIVPHVITNEISPDILIHLSIWYTVVLEYTRATDRQDLKDVRKQPSHTAQQDLKSAAHKSYLLSWRSFVPIGN